MLAVTCEHTQGKNDDRIGLEYLSFRRWSLAKVYPIGEQNWIAFGIPSNPLHGLLAERKNLKPIFLRKHLLTCLELAEDLFVRLEFSPSVYF